jgi:alginate O-acetyltransferase complex protein AlgI
MGGYRSKTRARSRELLITFLLIGLWHGAAWTFIVWGGLQGVLIIVEQLIRKHVWDFAKVKHPVGRAALAVMTFGVVCAAGVFFRANSIGQAWLILVAMFTPGTSSALVPYGAMVIAIAAGAIMIGAQIRFGYLRGWDWLDRWNIAPRTASIALALAAIVFSPGFNPAFIYFQF